MSFNSLANNTNTRQKKQVTLQSKPAGNAPVEQVKNNAGGFVFEITPLQKLDRFLMIGTTRGTFYQSEQNLTDQNVDAIVALIKANGKVVIDRCVEISQAGRAKNNDYALLVMALVFAHGDVATKMYAKDKVNLVARTGTHFLHFVAFCNGLRGWGRSLKNVAQKWYSDKNVSNLAYQVVKYKQRDGWSHRDVMRLSHIKPGDDVSRQNLYKYIVKGPEALAKGDVVPEILIAVERAKTASTTELVKLIQDFKLTHEMIPNEQKNDARVWEALVPHMGLTALTRNLNKLTAVGLVKPFSETGKLIHAKLGDLEALRKDRVHPLTLLVAQKIYSQGRGDKGSLVWTPDQKIKGVLEDAFYLAFQTVEPSGKNHYLALDVSSSMTWASSVCSGAPQITAREGSAVMAMVTLRTEPNTYIAGFSTGMRDIPLTKNDSLENVLKKIQAIPMGGTDCSLPILDATKRKLDVDCFSIYTDNETYAGTIHPFQAMRKFRQEQRKPEAKLVVCGMATNNFTIADPTDAGMLDVVGFDTATPRFISDFAAGRL